MEYIVYKNIIPKKELAFTFEPNITFKPNITFEPKFTKESFKTYPIDIHDDLLADSEPENSTEQTPTVQLSADSSKLDIRLKESIDAQLGKPYRFGANHYGRGNYRLDSPSLDCSSFTAVCLQAAYGTNKFNGDARLLYKLSVHVDSAAPGDLIFFKNTANHVPHGMPSHIGIVTKVDANGNPIEMAHASSSKGTRKEQLNTKYWKGHFLDVRRPII